MSTLHKTQGILLKETMLANDDVILDVFTYDFGRLTIFVSKLQRSKKKRAEIDFFRLLDLELSEKNHYYKLRSVSTKKVFHAFSKEYDLINQGFLFLVRLQKVLPEAKPLEDVFLLLCRVFEVLDAENKTIFMIYLRMQTLIFSGLMPRFDLVRGDTFFDPINLEFISEETEYSLWLNNESRQMIEFLRRLQFNELFLSYEKLLGKDFTQIQDWLNEVEKYH